MFFFAACLCFAVAMLISSENIKHTEVYRGPRSAPIVGVNDKLEFVEHRAQRKFDPSPMRFNDKTLTKAGRFRSPCQRICDARRAPDTARHMPFRRHLLMQAKILR